MSGAGEGLPLYECHKRVRAAKIIESTQTSTGFDLVLELPNGTTVHHYYQPPGRQANATSFVGGYLVVYADGYESWSPAKAFEEGYQMLREL